MKEEIKAQLSSLFDGIQERIKAVGEVFEDYFGKELVDVQILTLEDFFTFSRNKTIGSFVRIPERTPDHYTISNGSISQTIPTEKWREDNNKVYTDVLDEEYMSVASESIQDYMKYFLDEDRSFIIIRFPRVTVTNEEDKSIDITELYARIGIDTFGRIRSCLRFYRAEYTVAQWISGYAHSHLPGAYLEWQSPCLGSGPIRVTQNYLRENYDLERFGLFCFELAKYVTVESLAGIPYIRLENVRSSSLSEVLYPCCTPNSYPCNGTEVIENFVKYYIRTQDFPVAFNGNKFVLGCSPVDFLVSISRCFIKWYNSCFSKGIYTFTLNNLQSSGVLSEYVISNMKLMTVSQRADRTNLQECNGRELFMFKGEPVRLRFTDLENEDNGNVVTLLHHYIGSSIIEKFLWTINYNYGQSNNLSEQAQNTAGKKHLFI